MPPGQQIASHFVEAQSAIAQSAVTFSPRLHRSQVIHHDAADLGARAREHVGDARRLDVLGVVGDRTSTFITIASSSRSAAINHRRSRELPPHWFSHLRFFFTAGRSDAGRPGTSSRCPRGTTSAASTRRRCLTLLCTRLHGSSELFTPRSRRRSAVPRPRGDRRGAAIAAYGTGPPRRTRQSTPPAYAGDREDRTADAGDGAHGRAESYGILRPPGSDGEGRRREDVGDDVQSAEDAEIGRRP